MKQFQLPVSDCGCFVAGEIGPELFSQMDGLPKYGVIVWYEGVDAVKAATVAASAAHWPDKS